MADIITHQAKLFLISLIYGGILGIWYDFFRVIRKKISHKNRVVHMEDILFCISAATGLFLLFQVYDQGSIRSYVLLGLFAGTLLYFFTLNFFVEKLLGILIEIVLTVIKITVICMGKPVKLIVNSLLKSLKKTIRTVRIVKSRK